MIERLLCAVLRYKNIARQGRLYIRRFYLSPRTWRWRLFLHHIHLPDGDPDPHDHPFPFTTLCVKGRYVEKVYERARDGQLTGRWTLQATRWLVPRHREATHAHRIDQTGPGGAWTLVLAGPSIREWGFFPPTGWVHWAKYLGVPNVTAEEDKIR